MEDHRPWGSYRVIAEEKDNKVKKITVYPGKRLSLQRHRHRAEHWYILKGEATVDLDNKKFFLKTSDSIDIPVLSLHRIENPCRDNLEFIEIQTGDYLEEDDIERFEDDFGRV
ncbi:MAG: phosphomannose isomerase type II C-terminal cupin domain [Thermodesulfobacteriota bacterium]|nr:phosphomannose isomerase type II C-terminal cupin domain [Thermodesulfobacteriota bacterium]